MDDVTELAELVQDEEILERTEKIVEDKIEEENSTTDSETTEIEFDDNISIEQIPDKKKLYQHSFHINRNYYKHIVGSKGTMLKRLCRETKTVIRISKKKKYIVIIGSVQKRVIHAKQRINNLIEDSKNKLRFTHFISIPTNTDEIKDNFIKFKENILKNCDMEASGFNENMFQKPEKLHLTISMLHLLDESDQQKAIEALHNCKKEIIDPILNEKNVLSMNIRGLKCMQDNPTKARILYFNVHDETGLLQKVSDGINNYFVERGLSRKQYDNVTLHVTVINTFYLKKKQYKGIKKNFDATNILNDHKDTYLGKVNLSTFHISKLTAKSPDGYFEATAQIEL